LFFDRAGDDCLLIESEIFDCALQHYISEFSFRSASVVITNDLEVHPSADLTGPIRESKKKPRDQ